MNRNLWRIFLLYIAIHLAKLRWRAVVDAAECIPEVITGFIAAFYGNFGNAHIRFQKQLLSVDYSHVVMVLFEADAVYGFELAGKIGRVKPIHVSYSFEGEWLIVVGIYVPKCLCYGNVGDEDSLCSYIVSMSIST